MRSNRLQVNTTKTEILWSTTGRRFHQLSQSPLRVGADHVAPAPASVVRELGIYLDSDVSMRSHVAKTVSACFAVQKVSQFGVSVDHFPDLFSSRWCRHSSCHDWTTEMQPWLAFRRIYSSSSNWSWTRRRDSCSLRLGTTTSLRSSTKSIGWEHRREFSSSLLFSCTSVGTGQYRRISPTNEFTADFGTRRRLRSSSLLTLNVRRTWLSTVGDRAFPVAAARTWNSLSHHVTSAPSMSRSRLKAFSAGIHYHDFYRNFCGVCAVIVIFGHFDPSFFTLLTFSTVALWRPKQPRLWPEVD